MKNQSFLNRLRYAFEGLRFAFNHEASFRSQSIMAALAFVVLALFKAEALWWALFSLTIAGVLAMEMMNTSLESVMDHLHPQMHPSIKVAKDCAAGAVLIFSGSSILVLIFFLISRFSEGQ